MNTIRQEAVLEAAIATLEALAWRQLEAGKSPLNTATSKDLKALARETMAVARSLRKLSEPSDSRRP